MITSYCIHSQTSKLRREPADIIPCGYRLMKIKFSLIGFFFLWTACSSLHSLKKNPSAEELFQHAKKLQKASYYKEALAYFKQFKGQFLYSRLVKEADLAIADIYFAQKAWPKAVQAYGQFFELYPQHTQSDKALLNLALSYFYQLPKTEDRDLSLSSKTLGYLNQHLKSFPKSAYKKIALDYKRKLLDLLARQQWMLARFHLKQGRFKSALPYIRNLKKNYRFLLPSKKNLATQKPQKNQVPISQDQALLGPVKQNPLLQKEKKPRINISRNYRFLLPSKKKWATQKPQKPRIYLPSLEKLKILETKAVRGSQR